MRLFVALNPPRDIRNALWAETTAIRDAGLPARWVAKDALHVTLKFLGEVRADLEPTIVETLTSAVAGTHAFGLAFCEFGAFPSQRRPRVIWAGLEREPALELLQHELERAMEPLGFEAQLNVFRPHITLGRAKRNARPRAFADLGPLLEQLEFRAAFVAESVDLMQSKRGPEGACYSVRHAVPLVGGDEV